MSRIGLKPVEIPEGVQVTLAEGMFTAKGSLGQLTCAIAPQVSVTEQDNQVIVKMAANADPKTKPLWGTTRANIQNTIIGVKDGFKKELEVNGVGYRANLQGSTLVMILGKSHDDKMTIPEGLKVEVDKKNNITISGSNKQNVGAFAAKIRSLRPPEPYKGKGVKYKDEYIERKEGKKK